MSSATTFAAAAGAGVIRRVAAAALAVADTARRWHRRERDLRHVMQLDDHLLRDIGLTRDQMMRDRLRHCLPR